MLYPIIPNMVSPPCCCVPCLLLPHRASGDLREGQVIPLIWGKTSPVSDVPQQWGLTLGSPRAWLVQDLGSLPPHRASLSGNGLGRAAADPYGITELFRLKITLRLRPAIPQHYPVSPSATTSPWPLGACRDGHRWSLLSCCWLVVAHLSHADPYLHLGQQQGGHRGSDPPVPS